MRDHALELVNLIFRSNFNHNQTRVTCLSSCCVPKVSQINGSQGESTNTDDLKRTDKNQNKRLANIEKKIAALSINKKQKPKNRKNKNRTTNIRRTADPFPGIASVSSMDAQPVVSSRDPTVASVVAQIAPFRVPRGVCNILHSTLPSQKFTARCVFTISPSANQETILNISPCIASDTVGKSATFVSGTRGNMYAQTFGTTTLASGITSGQQNSNTPYPLGTLGGGDYQWRLVSCGVRIRNTTAAVSRQGVLKSIVDFKGVLVRYGDAATSFGFLCDAVDSNHRAVRRNMASQPEHDVVISGQLADFSGWSQCQSTSYAAAMDNQVWPTGVGPAYNIAGGFYRMGPGIVLFPAVPTAQTYDVEVIEHWEIHGTLIETLHTPSGSHIGSADLAGTLVSQAHHQHALTPSMALHDVAKGIAFAEHHKAAIKDCASVAAALAIL